MQHVFTGCSLSRGTFRHKQYSSVLFWAAEGWVTGCLGVRDETRADLCFSITPQPQWETLLSQDTSKSLSDISRILVIFYLKQALLLDTVSPPPPSTPTTATIIVKIYPDCGLLTLHSSGMCLHSQSCNHCLIFLYWWVEEGSRRKTVHSSVKCVQDAASSPEVRANNVIIQAWPYLGRAQCYVNRAYCRGEGTLLHSCPRPSTGLLGGSVEKSHEAVAQKWLWST